MRNVKNQVVFPIPVAPAADGKALGLEPRGRELGAPAGFLFAQRRAERFLRVGEYALDYDGFLQLFQQAANLLDALFRPSKINRAWLALYVIRQPIIRA